MMMDLEIIQSSNGPYKNIELNIFFFQGWKPNTIRNKYIIYCVVKRALV